MKEAVEAPQRIQKMESDQSNTGKHNAAPSNAIYTPDSKSSPFLYNQMNTQINDIIIDTHDPLNQHHYQTLMTSHLNKVAGTNNNKSVEVHQDGSSKNDASFKHSTNTSKGRNSKNRREQKKERKAAGAAPGQMKDNLSGLFDEIINRPEDRMKGSHNHVSAGEE